MDEAKRAQLLRAGVSVDEALSRFLGNEALLTRFLLRFPQDASFAQLLEAMEQGDARAAFEAAHTLKGVAGNLSLQPVFALASDVTETLRAGDLEAARAKLDALRGAHRQAVEQLSALQP